MGGGQAIHSSGGSKARPWLDALEPDFHINVRAGHRPHTERVGRLLADRGAPGLAHLGHGHTALPRQGGQAISTAL